MIDDYTLSTGAETHLDLSPTHLALSFAKVQLAGVERVAQDTLASLSVAEEGSRTPWLALGTGNALLVQLLADLEGRLAGGEV